MAVSLSFGIEAAKVSFSIKWNLTSVYSNRPSAYEAFSESWRVAYRLEVSVRGPVAIVTLSSK